MKPKPIVLVIDNDKAERRLLRLLLESQSYRVFEAGNGYSGVAAVPACKPDVIILESSVPDMDVPGILRRLREFTQNAVLVLSTSDQEADIVAALEGGASDYLVKPFGESELLARLRVLQRSLPGESYEDLLVEEGVTLDLTSHTVTLNGSEIDLRPIEEALLHSLMAHAGVVLTEKYLLKTIWGESEGKSQEQSLRVFISLLRKKLEPGRDRVVIEHVPDYGYRLWLKDFVTARNPRFQTKALTLI